jgi:hypothetical protein
MDTALAAETAPASNVADASEKAVLLFHRNSAMAWWNEAHSFALAGRPPSRFTDLYKAYGGPMNPSP